MKQVVSAQTRYRALPIIMEGIAAGRGYRLEHWNTLRFAVNRQKKIIYVPRIQVIGSDEDAVCLEGGIDHELMHVDQTDPDIKVTDPAHHRLWNIIEDARGEVGFFQKYPGSARHVKDTLNVLSRKGCFEVPSVENAFNVLCAFLLFELRAGVLGQTQFCSGVRDRTAQIARQLFGALADSALGIAREVVLTERGYPGSYKALEAAVRILELFSNPHDQKADGQKSADDKGKGAPGGSPDQNGEGDSPMDASGGEGSPGADTDAGEQGSSAPADKKGTNAGQQTQGDDHASQSNPGADDVKDANQQQSGHAPSSASSQQGKTDGAGAASDEPAADHGATTPSGNSGKNPQKANAEVRSQSQGGAGSSTQAKVTAEQIKTAATAVSQGMTGEDCPYGKGLEEHISGEKGLDLQQRAATGPQGKGIFLDGRGGGESSSGTRLKNLQQSNRITLSLSLKLEDLLSAMANVEQRYARSGRFDSERAVLTAIGNRRVYRRKAAQEQFNTAVCMLVDNSGSMSRRAGRDVKDPTLMQLANASIIGMGNVLDQNEVPFSVISFSDNAQLEHDFDDSWRKTLARYCVEEEYGTRMGEAYLHAVSSLIQRDEERRIILLITDGKPADWTSLEVSVQEAKRWGIETRTVLICPDEVSIDRFAGMKTAPGVAHAASGVPQAIFTTLERSLRS